MTLKVGWKGKTFEESVTVPVISQPFVDINDTREYNNWLKDNQKKYEQLVDIRSKIAYDPRFAELLPFYYKVYALVEGYDPKFGIYEPDYQKIKRVFDKYCSDGFNIVPRLRYDGGIVRFVIGDLGRNVFKDIRSALVFLDCLFSIIQKFQLYLYIILCDDCILLHSVEDDQHQSKDTEKYPHYDDRSVALFASAFVEFSDDFCHFCFSVFLYHRDTPDMALFI